MSEEPAQLNNPEPPHRAAPACQYGHFTDGVVKVPLSPHDFAADGVDPRLIAGRTLRYWLVRYLHGGVSRSGKVEHLCSRIYEEGFVLDGRASKVVSDALSCEVRRGRIFRIGWGHYGPGAAVPRTTRQRIEEHVGLVTVAMHKDFERAGERAFRRFCWYWAISESTAVFRYPGLQPGPAACQPVMIRAEVIRTDPSMQREKSLLNGQMENNRSVPAPSAGSFHGGSRLVHLEKSLLNGQTDIGSSRRTRES